MSQLIINTITAVVSVFALRKYYIVYGLVLIIESILMGNYNKKLQSNGIFAKVVSNRIGIRYCYSLSYAYFQTYLVFLRRCLNSNLIIPILNISKFKFIPRPITLYYNFSIWDINISSLKISSNQSNFKGLIKVIFHNSFSRITLWTIEFKNEPNQSSCMYVKVTRYAYSILTSL